VASVKILGAWACCFSSKKVGGRSIIYVNTSYGVAQTCTVIGLHVEHSGAETSQQHYGIYFGDAAATVVGWTVIGGTWQNRTNFIAASSEVTLADSFISHSNEIYDNGIDIPGTLERCVVEGVYTVRVGTSVSNRITTIGANLNANMVHKNDIIFDIGTGSIGISGSFSKLS
jgi:hypothetical protein